MGERVRIALVCAQCGARNYKRTKARTAQQTERLELKKFCPTCGAHTIHRESR